MATNIKTLYHGSSIFFKPPFHEAPTFFADNYEYALQHAVVHTGGSVVVVKVQVDMDKMKWFDPRKQGHRDLLRDALPNHMRLNVYDDFPIELNRLFLLRQLALFTDDVWRYLECSTIMGRIKHLGFDGHIAREDNNETYCIYRPLQHVQKPVYLQEMEWEQFNSYYKE